MDVVIGLESPIPPPLPKHTHTHTHTNNAEEHTDNLFRTECYGQNSDFSANRFTFCGLVKVKLAWKRQAYWNSNCVWKRKVSIHLCFAYLKKNIYIFNSG